MPAHLFHAQLVIWSLIHAIILLGLAYAYRLSLALWWGLATLFLALGTSLWGIGKNPSEWAEYYWIGYGLCMLLFCFLIWHGRTVADREGEVGKGQSKLAPKTSLYLFTLIFSLTIAISLWAWQQNQSFEEKLLVMRYGFVSVLLISCTICSFGTKEISKKVYASWMMRFALTALFVFEFMCLILLALHLYLQFQTHLILVSLPMFEVLIMGFVLMSMVVQSYEQIMLRHRRSFWQLSQSYMKYKELANRDPLTAVLNRHAFYLLYDSRRQKADLPAGSVAVIDIDNLKPINDRHGHNAGDAAIRTVAKAIRSIIRAEDLLFRWGGDEFLVILPHVAEHEARIRFDLLNTHLKKTVLSDVPEPVDLYTSVGIAAFESFDHLEKAIQEADERMYSRKVESKTVKQFRSAL